MTRWIAALQAATTVLVVLVAAHHQAEVRHVETAAGEVVHAALDCTGHATDTAFSSKRGAIAESETCLLCLAAHAPTALAAPPAIPTPVTGAAPAAIAVAADPPPRAAAIWRTAPKTSPPV